MAVKGDRKATMNDTTGQIVDLREEKIYDLDMQKKTYQGHDLRRAAAADGRSAEEGRRRRAKGTGEEKPQRPSARSRTQKELEVDFDVKDTGEKKTINGFDTRQVVMTDHRARERQDARAERRSGADLRHLAGAGDCRDEGTRRLRLRYAQSPRADDGRRVGRGHGGRAGDVSGLKDALAKMRAEGAKIDGTPILTTVTIDAVKSAEQMAEEAEAGRRFRSRRRAGPVGGCWAVSARRGAKKDETAVRRRARLS